MTNEEAKENNKILTKLIAMGFSISERDQQGQILIFTGMYDDGDGNFIDEWRALGYDGPDGDDDEEDDTE